MILQCRLFDIPTVTDERGQLSFFVKDAPVPFAIERIYYLHHIPKGARRGGHAHRLEEKFLIAFHGRCRVMLDDGGEQQTFTLDNPTKGLYVAKMIWLDIDDFSADAVVAVATSRRYEEDDYIRDKKQFLSLVPR